MSTSPSSETTETREYVTLPIADVKPYWRNPRRITDEAINALAESIKRYGYLQPIVVDQDDVIIIGHTRYMAIRRLGYEDVVVVREKGLSQQEVKQLRAIDNKVAEFTSWDFDKLVDELTAVDADTVRSFFPEMVGDRIDSTIEVDFSTSHEPAPELSPHERNDVVEFICPSCFYGWAQRVTIADITSGIIKGKKAKA